MPEAPDNNVLELLVDIRSTLDAHSEQLRGLVAIQEDNADKLGLLGTIGLSVAELHHDVRSQLQTIRGELHGRFQEVRGDAQEVRGEIHGALQEVRGEIQEVRSEVQNLRGEVRDLRGDVQAIRVELDVVHADAHDTRNEIHEIRGDIRQLQSDLAEVHRFVVSDSNRLEFLDEQVEVLRGGTMTAIRSASKALKGNEALKEEIAEATKRIEKLEHDR